MAKHKRHHQSTKQICLSTKWDFFVAEQKEGNYTTPFCSEKEMFFKKDDEIQIDGGVSMWLWERNNEVATCLRLQLVWFLLSRSLQWGNVQHLILKIWLLGEYLHKNILIMPFVRVRVCGNIFCWNLPVAIFVPHLNFSRCK